MGTGDKIHADSGDPESLSARPSTYERIRNAPTDFHIVARAANEASAESGTHHGRVGPSPRRAARRLAGVDWHAYAECYDLLCSVNPAYRELLTEFGNFVRGAGLRQGAEILDLGGGTGNFFSLGLPRQIAVSSRLIHLDSDSRMVSIAQRKYDEQQLQVRTIRRDAHTFVFPAASLDCILSVNALYAMPNPVAVLRKAFHWLRPGGRLFLVNLGRVLDSADWRAFLLRTNVRDLGVVRALRILLTDGRVIARANERIADAQRVGQFWTHSTEEFGTTLQHLGYELDEIRPVYRGYSDLVIAHKPSVVGPSEHPATPGDLDDRYV